MGKKKNKKIIKKYSKKLKMDKWKKVQWQALRDEIMENQEAETLYNDVKYGMLGTDSNGKCDTLEIPYNERVRPAHLEWLRDYADCNEDLFIKDSGIIARMLGDNNDKVIQIKFEVIDRLYEPYEAIIRFDNHRTELSINSTESIDMNFSEHAMNNPPTMLGHVISAIDHLIDRHVLPVCAMGEITDHDDASDMKFALRKYVSTDIRNLTMVLLTAATTTATENPIYFIGKYPYSCRMSWQDTCLTKATVELIHMKKDAHGHWIEEIDESSCNCECTECEHGGYCEDSHFPEEYEDENDEDIQTPKHKVDDYTIDNVYAAVKDLIDNDGLTPGTKLTITISQCGEDEDDGDEDDKFINEAQEALSKIRLKDGEEVSLRVHKDADAEKVDVIEEDDKSEAVDVIEDETESTDNN